MTPDSKWIAIGIFGVLTVIALIVAIIAEVTKASNDDFDSVVTSIATSNGFKGTITKNTLTMDTSVSGVIKGEDGELTQALSNDITSFKLTDFEVSSGVINASDTILQAFQKLAGNSSVSGAFLALDGSTTMNGEMKLGTNNITGVGNIAASTLSASSAITSSGPITGNRISFTSTSGIIGTITNNNAAAGSVGESIASTFTAALSSGTLVDITSISLTAGDWDVFGSISVAPSDVLTGVKGGINIVSETLPLASTGVLMELTLSFVSGQPFTASVGSARFSVSSTTTVYLVMVAAFASTCDGTGFIRARRVR